MAFSYVGLQDPPIHDPDVVGLESNDGTVRIQISRADAENSTTLRNLIVHAGTDNYIPLRNTDGPTLLLLERFIKNPDALVADDLNDNDLLNLLETANYLDLSNLIYHLIPTWVNSTVFPGRYAALKGLIPKALYFFNATHPRHFKRLPIDSAYVEPFRNFIKVHGPVQWALKLAAKNGETEVVKRLLANPLVDPSIDNHFALRFAGNGPTELVRLLLNHPSYQNLDRDAKQDLLREAVEGSYESVVNVLLDPAQNYNLDASVDDNIFIVWAARNGKIGIVRRLLQERNVDPGARANGPLLDAVRGKHVEVVRELLRHYGDRVDPSAHHQLALYYAASRQDLPMVEVLLKDKRVDPSDTSHHDIILTAMQYGYYYDKYDVIRMLLKDERVDIERFLKIDPNNAKVQELYREAMERRKRKRIEAPLLYVGLKDPTIDQKKFMHDAAQEERLEILELLLQDERIDPEPLLDFSNNSMIMALYNRRNELVERARRTSRKKARMAAQICMFCNVANKPVMACGACAQATYCGVACQRADWARHASKCSAATTTARK